MAAVDRVSGSLPGKDNLFFSFSCFFPPTNLVLGERNPLRYFVFSFNEEFPSKRSPHDLPRWRASLEQGQHSFERPTRLKLPYDPSSDRKSRFTRWAHATRLALATAQGSCSYARVMRGTEIRSHKVETQLSFTHIRSTSTSM